MQQSFETMRPKTRAEAIDLLTRLGDRAAPFIVQPKPIALRQMGVDFLIDLSLLGLETIQKDDDGRTHIGSLATLQELIENPSLNEGVWGILSQAAGLAATPGIRNLSGLWGVLQARSGSPEVILALLVLEAQVVLLSVGDKQRTLTLPEFYEENRISLPKGELVLEVCLLPVGNGWGGALARVARTPRDEAIVAAAAIVEVKDGKANRVKLALAGANPVPMRIPAVEDMLNGKVFDAQNLQAATKIVEEQADPPGDFRGSSEYRRSMAGLVVRRALNEAWKKTTVWEK